MPTLSLPEALMADGTRLASAWSLFTALTVAELVGLTFFGALLAQPVRLNPAAVVRPITIRAERRIFTSFRCHLLGNGCVVLESRRDEHDSKPDPDHKPQQFPTDCFDLSRPVRPCPARPRRCRRR